MDSWDLVVVIENKKKKIEVPEDCLVSELINIVAQRFDQQPRVVELIFANLPEQLALDNERVKNQRLSQFGIKDGSVLTMVLRMFGGIWVLDALRDRKRTLQDLPPFITVTTDPNEPDMISLDDSPANKRARMPCGHVIGPESMTSYCQSLLSQGKFIFRCPFTDKGRHCNREWPFTLVRHVACLTVDEQEEIEQKIEENVLRKARGIGQCPNCDTWCFRDNPRNDCVICSVCTKNHGGETYQFCWQCLGEWKGGAKNCGNPGCLEMDKRLEILATCPEKLIQHTNMCPSIRGCPNCGELIEHAKKCKHMTCSMCGHNFCFICLKEKKGGIWQCAAYMRDCEAAPRQTKVVNLKDSRFTALYNPSDPRN